MPAYVLEVVIWTSVAAFVVCVICGLAMITGLWSHPDPKIKNWLTKGVIMAVVGGVVAYAVGQFKANTPDTLHEPETNVVAPRMGIGEDNAARKRTPSKDQVDRGDVESEQGDEPIASEEAPSIPAGIETWAKQALGPRPLMRLMPLPACVATLSGRENGGASDADASSCRSALEQLHQDVVVAFYNIKRPYDVRLQRVEMDLRMKGLRADELDKFNYVAEEMQRLNGWDSKQRKAFRDFEERLLDNIRDCEENYCRP